MTSKAHAIAVVASACLITAGESRAAVTLYTNQSDWQSAVVDYSTITFTELPAATFITEQYSYLGVHFTDGADQVFHNANLFPADGYGLNGAFDSTTLLFDGPMTSIALFFPGSAMVKLFSAGQLIYTSPELGGSGAGNFGGLVSTVSFDKAIVFDPTGGFFADNLYFGPPVPGPGAVTLLAVGGLMTRSRRRRQV